MIAAYSSDIGLDADLFDRLKQVKDYSDQEGIPPLTTEQQVLLKNTYDDFVDSGALLDEQDKKRFREISQELSTLGSDFSDNLVKSSEKFKLHITDKNDLSGLPDGITEAAALTAKDLGQESWVFTLDYPSYGPFMTYADNRDLRQKMSEAFAARAHGDEFDNCETIKKIISLEHEKSQILGYATTADYILKDRMAKTPQTVFDFLDDLSGVYKQIADEELDELKIYAAQKSLQGDLKPWDVAYYSEKLQKQLYDISDEDLRPYLQLDNVLNGAFTHFEKLFDVRFEEDNSYPKYHADVKTFNVINNKDNSFVGSLMADFHPRSGKKSGAWMTEFRRQGLYDGKVERPVIAIVCNFTKPTDTMPSLLTHSEITTLFHEMGHAVHGLMSDVTYPSLASPHVKWDFVELPSQLQENWCFEKETLDTFAVHYKTGEKMPEELIEKLRESQNFHTGLAGLRQATLGLTDMAWYTADPSKIGDVAQFELDAKKDLSLFPEQKSIFSTSFGHIFGGGYSAGYYSYKWAEVLDADAFEAFLENGLYDQKTALSYKNQVLAKGGTNDPEQLYINFRGRKADPDALLRREDLLHDDTNTPPNLVPPSPEGPGI